MLKPQAKPPAGPFALVLQGGGALGAYELGAMRRLYAGPGAGKTKPPAGPVFEPEVIAGVSIGAITAVLLARPKGGNPLAALEAFWREVAVADWLLPPGFGSFASMFGNPHFFMPRTDYLALPGWTSLYDTGPLRRTLEALVDIEALATTGARPRLIVSATNIESGGIKYFDSDGKEGPLSLDHILASGSLPPSFPMTKIGESTYWDGGLFDNTPLGPVIDALPDGPGNDRVIIVVNLFPNSAQIPSTMLEVGRRMLNLMFANRTKQDLRLLERFNQVADLIELLDRKQPQNSPIRDEDAFKDVFKNGYSRVPHVIEITRQTPAGGSDAFNFSPEGIQACAAEGCRDADTQLGAFGL